MSMRADWTAAKAAYTYLVSVSAAQKAALGYQQALERLVINDVARRTLDTHLTMHVMAETTTILKDRDRLGSKIAAKRKK